MFVSSELLHFLDLPYDRRRLIIIRPRFDNALVPTTSAVGLLRDLVRGKQGLDDIPRFSPEEAARYLEMPAGHPKPNKVYVGHPLVHYRYLPVETFHEDLLKEKDAELFAVLASLGATRITLTRKNGDSANAKADAKVRKAKDSAKASATGKYETFNETFQDISLAPRGKPYIPEDLLWFPNEPDWKFWASMRLDKGATEINVKLRHSSDIGIDASVVAKLPKIDIDTGASFSRVQTTEWEYKVTFAPLTD